MLRPTLRSPPPLSATASALPARFLAVGWPIARDEAGHGLAAACALLLTYPIFSGSWRPQRVGAAGGVRSLSLIGRIPYTAFYVALAEALPKNIRGGAFATVYAVAIASFGGNRRSSWLPGSFMSPVMPWRRPGTCCSAATSGSAAMAMMRETAGTSRGNRGIPVSWTAFGSIRGECLKSCEQGWPALALSRASAAPTMSCSRVAAGRTSWIKPRRFADPYAGIFRIAILHGRQVTGHLALQQGGVREALFRDRAIHRQNEVFMTRAVNGLGQSILRTRSTTVVRMVASPSARTAARWWAE